MSFVGSARRTLVNIGKILPFAICFIVLISYAESIYAMASENYIDYEDYVSLNKPISVFIGSILEYDWITVTVLAILSVSLETCVWNKAAVIYLLANILFKKYIEDVEISVVDVYVFSVLNMTICGILITKGLKKLNLFCGTK